MTLTDSGIAYDQPSLVLDTDPGINRKYRGRSGQYRYPSPMPRLPPKPSLTDQGVTQSAPSHAEVGSTCPVSLWEVQKVVTHELSQIHFENIRKSLEKRLQVAEERGDMTLIQLLNREFEQLTTFS